MSVKKLEKKDKIEEELDTLKENIQTYYNKMVELNVNNSKNNIYRGHVWPMGYKFEDEFASFLSEVIDDKSYNFYIDFTLKKLLHYLN